MKLTRQEKRKVDAIANELWAVLRSHHVPMAITIRAMRKFYEPLRTFELIATATEQGE